jgi:hypothetical protein
VARRDLVDYDDVARQRWVGGVALGLHRRGGGHERTLFNFAILVQFCYPGVQGQLEIQGHAQRPHRRIHDANIGYVTVLVVKPNILQLALSWRHTHFSSSQTQKCPFTSSRLRCP